MTDIENGMVLEQVTKKQRIYCYCDHCNEPIFERQEVALLGDGDMAIICHKECWDDFIRDNKEEFIAEERM